MKRTPKYWPGRLVLISLILLVSAAAAPAQLTADAFRKLLADNAAFEPADLAALDSGDAVVKVLPVTDKQFVAVCGVVRLDGLPLTSTAAFRASLTQKSNESMRGGGMFSKPPVIEDLKALKLEEKDFKELKKCLVGDCDMHMSAAMIKRLNAEVDWNSAEYRSQATEFIRQMLLGYVRDYSVKGDQALGEYANRRKSVDLAEAHRSLLENSLFIRDLAPELYSYLDKFPGSDLKGVDSDLHWSTVNFGLKPMITLSHVAAYDRSDGNATQHFLATKQIYASRYLDASLTFTFLLRFSANNTTESYLVFSDRSRSDALGGIFEGMTRSVVENEAVERVKNMLQNAELRLLAETKQRSEPEPLPGEPTFVERARKLLLNPYSIAIILLSVGVIVYGILRRRERY